MSEQDEIAALLMSGLDWAEAHLRASLDHRTFTVEEMETDMAAIRAAM